MLKVNIEKKIGDFHLKVAFNQKKGVLGILAPSGSGKTMTLKAISGLLKPDKGKLKLDDCTMFSSEDNINLLPRNRKIGYLFQNYGLFPHLSIYKNIEYGIKHLKKTERVKKIKNMLRAIELEDKENSLPKELSGGQQQRVALGRTLVTEPRLLLLDEPFSAIDESTKYRLEKKLMEIIENNYNGIVLLVSHNLEEVYRISDDIIVIDNGKILSIGKKDEVIDSPTNEKMAKILGYKNILEGKIKDFKENYVYLDDIKIKVKRKVKNGSVKIAIREEKIKIVDDVVERENTFKIKVKNKIESLTYDLITGSIGGRDIYIKASKGDKRLKNKEIVKVHIAPEDFKILE